VTDDTLRLPTSVFRAVLNLGPKRAAGMRLPTSLSTPDVDAEWDEETSTTAVSVDYDDGQLHLDVSEQGVEVHFHDGDGEVVGESPWSPADTPALMTWALAFAEDVHALMPGLEEDAAEAAAWHEEGFGIYVCETEPAALDLLEIEIEGEILTLPWLGAGRVDQQHVDGDDHPIELLWTPGEGDPDRPIAKAWYDADADEPRSAPIPGTDWQRVGLPAEEVLPWLEGVYLNHHIIEDPETAVFLAALERIGGLDAED